MRTKWSIINMFTGFFAQAALLCVGLLSRKIFIQILSIEYLGCDGVFSNILHILTLAGCGASAVSYIIIKAVATENEQEIQKAFSLIRYYQLCSCGAFLGVGLILGLFLPFFLSNSTSFQWSFLRVVYAVFLVDLLLSMWSGMAGTPGRYDCIIKASQRQAICSLSNCSIRIGITVVQMIALWMTHNYIIYLVFGICSKLLYICFTRWYCFHHFPYLKVNVRLTREYIRSKNLFREIRSNFTIMLAIVVFGNTDNLVLASFFGIAIAGIYSNYYLLYSQLCNLVSKFVDGLSVPIANLVNSGSNEQHQLTIFYRVQTIAAIFACFSAVGFYGVSESMIAVFFGEEFLLSILVCICLSGMIFLSIYQKAMAMFRHSVGQYWRDKWFQTAAAAVNLILSIFLASKIGIVGVLIGTIVGILIQSFGYIKVVKEQVLPQLNLAQWLAFAMQWLFISVIGCAASSLLLANAPVSFLGILIRMCSCVVISTVLCGVMIVVSKYTRDTVFFGIKYANRAIETIRINH